MQLFDVNIFITAYRAESPGHERLRPWFEGVVASVEPFGISDLALSGFLRIVTNARVFEPPEPMAEAVAFANYLWDRPNAVRVRPGPHHWRIFTRLCVGCGVKGKLVPDAWFAALAIESGCQWVTLDRDFARFDGLDWALPGVTPEAAAAGSRFS